VPDIERPTSEVWNELLKAFSEIGPNVRKVAKHTSQPITLVQRAWTVGWPGRAARPEKRDDEGNILQERVPPTPPLLPLQEVIHRAKLHARKAREKVYRETVKAHTDLISDATNDAMRQRGLEALAVRTALMLGDQATKNALQLQLATVPMYENLAAKLHAMAADPDKSAGAIMKVLREVGEIGRLAVQQVETAMVLERKHLGVAEGMFKHEVERSSDDVMKDIQRLLVLALSDKMAQADKVIEAELVAHSGPAVPSLSHANESVWTEADSPVQD